MSHVHSSYPSRQRSFKKAMRALHNSRKHPIGSRREKMWMNSFRKCLKAAQRGIKCYPPLTEIQEVDTDRVIKLKSIEIAGGACPYQIEATTEEDEFFYLRYRHGWLRYGLWKTSAHFNHRDYLFSKKLGDRLDGWARQDEFSSILQGKVIFPEGFVFKY